MSKNVITYPNPVRRQVPAEVISFPSVFYLRELADLSAKSVGERLADLRLKRIVDVILASVMLVLAAPVIAIAAILIRLESDGDAVFTQERVGARYQKKNGRIIWKMCLFRCYKLRTMRKDSDPAIHKNYLLQFRSGHVELGSTEAPFKLHKDPRVTRIGQWLRRTSLDELPQLVNVIKGDMSLVGPRPVPVYEVELYNESHFNRLAARPGITGLWQVYGRSRVEFEQMIEMDIEYARQSSLWCDLKLLLLTVGSVVSRKGAA